MYVHCGGGGADIRSACKIPTDAKWWTPGDDVTYVFFLEDT